MTIRINSAHLRKGSDCVSKTGPITKRFVIKTKVADVCTNDTLRDISRYKTSYSQRCHCTKSKNLFILLRLQRQHCALDFVGLIKTIASGDARHGLGGLSPQMGRLAPTVKHIAYWLRVRR